MYASRARSSACIARHVVSVVCWVSLNWRERNVVSEEACLRHITAIYVSAGHKSAPSGRVLRVTHLISSLLRMYEYIMCLRYHAVDSPLFGVFAKKNCKHSSVVFVVAVWNVFESRQAVLRKKNRVYLARYLVWWFCFQTYARSSTW
jgi:hypothetical protein